MHFHIHLRVIVLDGKAVFVSITLMEYNEDEMKLRCGCGWCCKHSTEKRVLYRAQEDIKCFQCVPWGNYNVAKKYTRIGILHDCYPTLAIDHVKN
jgi:hypothetical protein